MPQNPLITLTIPMTHADGFRLEVRRWWNPTSAEGKVSKTRLLKWLDEAMKGHKYGEDVQLTTDFKRWRWIVEKFFHDPWARGFLNCVIGPLSPKSNAAGAT